MKYLYTILVVVFYTFNTHAQIDIDLDIVNDSSNEQLEFNNTNEKNEKTSNSIVESTLNLFKKGSSSEKVPSDPIEDLIKRAKEGNVEAQLDLGYMYLYGVNGVNIDYKQSLYYYEMAANNGNAIALNNLGSLHFNGIGTEVNYSKAIEFFKAASSLGSDDASVNLAIIYLGDSNTNKTPDTYENVFKLLESAKQNSTAKYLLGYSYYVGFWVEKDLKKAFELIKEVADKDMYDEAQYVLADFFINGYATPKNYNKAVTYLYNASSQGYPDAIFKLGDIFAEGIMYKRDIKRAHIQYNIAAVMGKEEAAEKRDNLEKSIKIEDLLLVQAEAENYEATPSAKTSFIRKTYGNSLKAYIDKNINYISLQ